MSWTPSQIAAQCRISSPFIIGLPTGIDGPQLLWALSGNESSFGANVTPRHEPAFDIGGSLYATSPAQQALVAQFGPAGACSYGPWQLMLCNAPVGSSPRDFNQLNLAAVYSCRFLSSLLRRFSPQTIGEIGSCWNAGHIQRPFSPQVQRYADELVLNYARPTPPVAAL